MTLINNQYFIVDGKLYDLNDATKLEISEKVLFSRYGVGFLYKTKEEAIKNNLKNATDDITSLTIPTIEEG